MDDILILTETELREAVQLDLAAVNTTQTAFEALAGEGVVMPPVLSMAFEEANGEVDVKTAYLPAFESFALKVSPGFFDNPKIGLPSLNGLMVVLSAKTGLVEAVLLDNGYLTNVRTAAAGAVAARALAGEVTTAGVIGSGVQARLQMQAAHLVKPYERGWVWSRDAEKARACAEDIAEATGAEVRVAESAEQAVRECELVITTTPATAPVIEMDWLTPGTHLTAMGSDQEGKNEIPPEALARADLYVCDRVAQAAKLGELRSAREAGLMKDDPPELGQVLTGKASGRTAPEQVTIADLTGTGAQDTAIANFALKRLREAGTGTHIPR